MGALILSELYFYFHPAKFFDVISYFLCLLVLLGTLAVIMMLFVGVIFMGGLFCLPMLQAFRRMRNPY